MELEIWIATNVVGSKCSTVIEIDDEELEGMTEQQHQKHFEEYAREEIWNIAECGWNEI